MRIETTELTDYDHLVRPDAVHGDVYTDVPYADAYEDLDMKKLGLGRPPRVASYRGFVFASLAPEGPDLDDELGGPCRKQIDLFCDLSPEGAISLQAGASKLAYMNVFPTLVVLGQQVRTIRPIHRERTDVLLAPALLAGVPDEVNTQRLRAYEAFYSPQGGGIHDDIEMFTRVTEGLRCCHDPWLLFQRGRHRERQDADGTVVGQVIDEVSQRAMWRRWKSLMESP